MKKMFAFVSVVIMFCLVMGCASVMTNTLVNAGSDLALAHYLKKNPAHINDVTLALKDAKVYLTCTECTFEQLKVEVIKRFGGEYKVYALIATDYITIENLPTDKFLTPETKILIEKKLDRLLTIVALVSCDSGGSCQL